MFVSERLRSYLEGAYPRLFEDKDNKSHLRFLGEMVVPRWVDPISDHVVVSRARLAAIEGREAELRGHRYRAGEYLQRVQDLGLTLHVTEANHWRGEARTVEVQWAPGLSDLIAGELLLLGSERENERQLQWVDLVTGRQISSSDLAAAKREHRKERQQREGTADVRMLNRVSPQTYNRFAPNMSEAQECANSIVAEGRRISNLGTLAFLNQMGLAPTYKDVLNSPRYYTDGSSMGLLSQNVRQALLGGSWALDLAASQLAILACLWDLPRLRSLLESAVHGSQSSQIEVWEPLLRAVGLGGLEHKRAFKPLVYSAAFGMSQKNLRIRAAKIFGKDQAEALFQTSLMAELLAGRRERGVRLKREGGIVDPMSGRHVSLAEREVSLRAANRSSSAVSSLMAYEAQAMELFLMQPVLDRMRKDARFRVVLWLHDGCYVTTGHHEDVERKQIERMVREVNGRAEKAGIATVLTYEKLI